MQPASVDLNICSQGYLEIKSVLKMWRINEKKFVGTKLIKVKGTFSVKKDVN